MQNKASISELLEGLKQDISGGATAAALIMKLHDLRYMILEEQAHRGKVLGDMVHTIRDVENGLITGACLASGGVEQVKEEAKEIREITKQASALYPENTNIQECTRLLNLSLDMDEVGFPAYCAELYNSVMRLCSAITVLQNTGSPS